ncbi:MAG: hypothetical protein D6722_16690 [Bacteroidetes bacterium]|nr:MAG: hypothetical protein D6722_16690 [Bacteroidota bacterium]
MEERLMELPAAVFLQLRRRLNTQDEVTRVTVHNVLKGKSQNATVILAIADFLKCTYRDVLDPEYLFRDPRELDDEARAALARQLKLTQAR